MTSSRIRILAAALVFSSGRLLAQGDMSAMNMPGMPMASPLGIPHSRIGSGTSWLPDSSAVREVRHMYGSWMVSLHGAAFGQYDKQETQRGDTQLGLTDWEMLMAMRSAAGGMLHVDLMTSVEPFVLGGAGYPLLLQTGGTYQHSFLHDRQHPHDALMELAAMYEHAITSGLGWAMYAGAVGEPALGPVAFMHRPSAQNDPMAPLGHHWQDVSHQSFGVVTVGLETHSVKLEGSLFNPREPDEHHLVVDYRGAKLDAYAGRLSWAASPHIVTSAWWGYLNSHDRLDPTTRMHRYGGSVLTDQKGVAGGRWSNTFMWSMNLHHHGPGAHEFLHGTPGASPHHHSSSMLAESSLEVGTKSAIFTRIEGVRKNGEELGFQGGDLTTLYDIRSYVLGATRQVVAIHGADFSVGARGAINFVARGLQLAYGTRRPKGFDIFLQLRPAGHRSQKTTRD
jgi:hypothetical protein